MTREQKMEWLRNASNEELMKQYEASTIKKNHGTLFDRENIEDLELVRAEVLRRLSR